MLETAVRRMIQVVRVTSFVIIPRGIISANRVGPAAVRPEHIPRSKALVMHTLKKQVEGCLEQRDPVKPGSTSTTGAPALLRTFAIQKDVRTHNQTDTTRQAHLIDDSALPFLHIQMYNMPGLSGKYSNHNSRAAQLKGRIVRQYIAPSSGPK